MSEPMTAETSTEPQSTSRWEDYIDVFISPAELFERRRHDRVAPPLITLLVLAVLFYFLLLPANTMIMRATMAENPDALEAMERMGTIMQVFGGIVIPITYLIMIGAAAALLWLGGRIADVRTDFSRTMLIATYAGYVYLLAQIAGSIAVILHGSADLDIVRDTSFGVLRFVGDSEMNPVLMAVLRRFEIFAIWQAILWGIGLATLYRIGRGRAAAIAGIAWLVFALPGVIAGAFGWGGPGGPPARG